MKPESVPGESVRWKEVSAIENVFYREVSLWLQLSQMKLYRVKFLNPGRQNSPNGGWQKKRKLKLHFS